jgi:hypothetical protein
MEKLIFILLQIKGNIMKSTFFTIITAITLVSISYNSYAIQLKMNNLTNKALLIQFELLNDTNPYFILVRPGQTSTFNGGAATKTSLSCLEKIKYLIPDQFLFDQKNIVDQTTMKVIDPKKLQLWIAGNKNDIQGSKATRKQGGYTSPYTLKEATLRFLSDQKYNDAINQVKKMGTNVGKKIIDWISNAQATSRCKNRDISIIEENNGEINFYTVAN